MLIEIDPQVQQEPEPEGYEFGYYVFDSLPDIEVIDIELTIDSITHVKTKYPSGHNFQGFTIDNDIFQKLEHNDIFCKNMLDQIKKGNIQEGQLFIVRDNILKDMY